MRAFFIVAQVCSKVAQVYPTVYPKYIIKHG